jgi:alpha-tubulin suppressor-like RCC1 family protein
LGDETTTDRLTPVQVSGLSDMVAVAAASFHSLAVRSDGTVWAWGENYEDQLDGTTTSRLTPVQVSGLSGVTAVATGGVYSHVVKSDGTVWVWTGPSYLVSLGTPSTPVQIPGLSGVVAVAASDGLGVGHGLAVTSDGRVWAWGDDLYGQLGQASSNSISYESTPRQIPGLTGVAAAAAGGGHSLFLQLDAGACESPPVECAEGQMCDPDTGECVACLNNADCDDWSFCNGSETCVDGTCHEGSAPCEANQTCDEDDNQCRSRGGAAPSGSCGLFGPALLALPLSLLLWTGLRLRSRRTLAER